MPLANLALEVPLFGVVCLWLLVLVPAAVVTVLKRHWSLFFVGWLTLGVTWLVGAVILAPLDSPWAEWFYDEKRRARAAEPLRHPRPMPAVALSAVAALIAIAVVGLLAARPTSVLGVDGTALGNSVDDGVLVGSGDCTRLRDDTWRCTTWNTSGGGTPYRVEVDRFGCWTASRIGSRGERRSAGCVTIVDFLS